MTGGSFAYRSAPITEAVVDLRIAPRIGFEAGQLASFVDQVSDEFPKPEQLKTASFQISAVPQPNTSADLTFIGYVGRSSDDLWVYQAQAGGLSVSRLAPYTRWSDLKIKTERLWRPYRESAQPSALVRIGLRYINRIDLPYKQVELSDFLRTRVETGENVPGTMSYFYLQTHLPQPDIDCLCVINSTLVPPVNAEGMSIILDIDHFKSGGHLSLDDPWTLLERMRSRKNEIFESCITSRTRELFNGASSDATQ